MEFDLSTSQLLPVNKLLFIERGGEDTFLALKNIIVNARSRQVKCLACVALPMC